MHRLYYAVYARLCGEHPSLRPWHFQWLAAVDLYADLRETLPRLEGAVVDVGCGDKPYRQWATRAVSYTGLDVFDGPNVDVLIQPNEPWPVDSESFDGATCTQVLEHVTDLEHTLSEIRRVLKPGGTLVATAPFAYPEHAAPHDYRRFSRHELERLLADDYEILDVRAQGGVGSTTGLYVLGWLETQINASRLAKLMRMALLPAWIALTALVNAFGRMLDRIDVTGIAYSNVLVVARKRVIDGPA